MNLYWGNNGPLTFAGLFFQLSDLHILPFRQVRYLLFLLIKCNQHGHCNGLVYCAVIPSVTVRNIWDKQLMERKGLFWLSFRNSCLWLLGCYSELWQQVMAGRCSRENHSLHVWEAKGWWGSWCSIICKALQVRFLQWPEDILTGPIFWGFHHTPSTPSCGPSLKPVPSGDTKDVK